MLLATLTHARSGDYLLGGFTMIVTAIAALGATLLIAFIVGLAAFWFAARRPDIDAVYSPEAREAAGIPCVFVEEEQ